MTQCAPELVPVAPDEPTMTVRTETVVVAPGVASGAPVIPAVDFLPVVKGKIGGAVTPPGCRLTIGSGVPIPACRSSLSVRDRCAPSGFGNARLGRRPHRPIGHSACGRSPGVKPKPPSAVASRGLTPANRPKHGSGSDSGTDRVFTVARLRATRRLYLACARFGSNGVCRSSSTHARPSSRSATPRSARPCVLPRRRSAAYCSRLLGSCCVATRAQ